MLRLLCIFSGRTLQDRIGFFIDGTAVLKPAGPS